MHSPEIRVAQIGPIAVWFYADFDMPASRVPKWQWLDPRRYGVYCRTRSGRWQFTLNGRTMGW